MANDEPIDTSATPETESAIFALLADRTLVGIEPARQTVVVRRSLGATTPIAGSGRFLALSGDGSRLFTLAPAAPDTAQAVTIFDSRSLRSLDRIPLERGIVFRAIDVGPRSGRLYLFGNRPHRRGAEDAVVALVDVDDGTARTWTVREADGYDWWIFDGAVASDESRLYLSYHGGCGPENPKLCTSGADWVDMLGDRLVRCERRSAPGLGCLGRVHGSVEPLNGNLLAATGVERLVELSPTRGVTATLRTRLGGNHLMEFAFDGLGKRAYAAGQCYYIGGVSIVDLKTKRTRVLTRDVCGERVAAGGDLIAVAEQFQATPLGSPSRIALVDARTGSARYVKVPVEAVDVLVIPPR